MIAAYVIYNIVLIFVMVFALAVTKAKDHLNEYIARFAVYLTLLIPAIIRDNVGKDYLNYATSFSSKEYLYNDHYEIGFKLLYDIFGVFTTDYYVIMAICAIIIYYPIAFKVPKSNYFLFLIFYVLTTYLATYSLIRQELAISFIIWGISVFNSKRGHLKLFLFIIIGSLFHTSALIVLPLILAFYIHNNTILSSIACGLVISAFIGTSMLSVFFNNPLFIESKYLSYALNGTFQGEGNVGSGLGVLIRILLPLTYIIQSFYKKKENFFYTGLAIYGTCTSLLAMHIYIMGRVASLFTFIPGIYIAKVFEGKLCKYRKLLTLLIIGIFIVLFERDIAVNDIRRFGGLGINPYQTFLFQ